MQTWPFPAAPLLLANLLLSGGLVIYLTGKYVLGGERGGCSARRGG